MNTYLGTSSLPAGLATRLPPELRISAVAPAKLLEQEVIARIAVHDSSAGEKR